MISSYKIEQIDIFISVFNYIYFVIDQKKRDTKTPTMNAIITEYNCKKEVRKLVQKVKLEGYTIIPLSVYLKDGLCKVNIALCRGKKKFDKREYMKKNDAKRQIEKFIK